MKLSKLYILYHCYKSCINYHLVVSQVQSVPGLCHKYNSDDGCQTQHQTKAKP